MYLATRGPLEGKFIFARVRHYLQDYLKKCSSVLGQSLIVSTFAELLISDKLSPEVLIRSPNRVFEAFRRIATTFCKGQENLV